MCFYPHLALALALPLLQQSPLLLTPPLLFLLLHGEGCEGCKDSAGFWEDPFQTEVKTLDGEMNVEEGS